MNKQVKLLISGRVQGVFFRVSTRDKAQLLGLNGWVKNMPDGRVAVFASGKTQAVDEFIAWCHIGPEQAYVNGVKISLMTEQLDQQGFKIL